MKKLPKKLPKKLGITLFVGLMLFTFSCSKPETEVQSVEKSELLNFVSKQLETNNSDIKVLSISQFKLDNYAKYVGDNIKMSRSGSEVPEPSSMHIVTSDLSYDLHTVPDSQTHATLYIQSENGELDEILELELSVYDPITDSYTYTWTLESSRGTRNRKLTCQEGAGSVIAVGGIISFGTTFGCIPCGFVGGAIIALGSIGYLGCVVTGN